MKMKTPRQTPKKFARYNRIVAMRTKGLVGPVMQEVSPGTLIHTPGNKLGIPGA